MNEQAATKESLIGMQIEENGKELQKLEMLCISLKDRLLRISRPESDNEETCEKLSETQMSDTRTALKLHQEKTKDINRLISDILERLEL